MGEYKRMKMKKMEKCPKNDSKNNLSLLEEEHSYTKHEQKKRRFFSINKIILVTTLLIKKSTLNSILKRICT